MESKREDFETDIWLGWVSKSRRIFTVSAFVHCVSKSALKSSYRWYRWSRLHDENERTKKNHQQWNHHHALMWNAILIVQRGIEICLNKYGLLFRYVMPSGSNYRYAQHTAHIYLSIDWANIFAHITWHSIHLWRWIQKHTSNIINTTQSANITAAHCHFDITFEHIGIDITLHRIAQINRNPLNFSAYIWGEQTFWHAKLHRFFPLYDVRSFCSILVTVINEHYLPFFPLMLCHYVFFSITVVKS